MSEIASRVKAIIVDKLGVEESEVTTEASFTNDLGADSVSYTHLTLPTNREGYCRTDYGIRKRIRYFYS